MMNTAELTAWLKRRARQLGFQLCGVCPAGSPPGAARLEQWLAAGYAGQMHYLADRVNAYHDPAHVLPGVRNLLMLGMQYSSARPATPGPLEGRVARYAWGEVDYHDLIREKLHLLADELRDQVPDCHTRGVVDTAPLLEREFAQLAGLGWIGKNTLLLSRTAGSYFFLAALLTDVELAHDASYPTDHCGSCTACLDACPTKAFPQPYVLDASRCISYLTIELHDAVPADLRAALGDWVFGCDVCQEVCPWNRAAPPTEQPAFAPHDDLNPLSLAELFEMDDEAFRRWFRQTPLWRAHRRGLLRSAALALGNRADPASIPVLAKALQDTEPVVRGAAAWALGQVANPAAKALLASLQAAEQDPVVLDEVAAALAR